MSDSYGKTTARSRSAVIALCAVQFVDVLGVTVVVSTLPSMLSDLHADATAGTLVATAYAMFFGGLLMLGARLGDSVGPRRVLLAGLTVFAVGAVIGACAVSLTMLVLARCLQGAAAALSVPAALTLLVSVTDDGHARDRAIALWSAAGAAAGASGFVVGGVVADLASWRVIFWAYVAVAAMLALVITRSVPGASDQEARTRRVNVLGGAVFTAAIMAVVVGLTLLSEPSERAIAVALLVVAVVLAVAFVVADRRSDSPLLPTQVLMIAPLRAGAGCAFVNTAATSSALTLVTLYVQDTLHRTSATAALSLLPFSLLVIAGSAAAGRLLSRWSPQRAMALGLAAIGLFDAGLCITVDSAWALPMCVAVGGLGIGLASVGATRLGTDVDAEARASASGILNTTAQLGTAVGVAVLTLVASATGRTPEPGVPAPCAAWLVAAGVAVLAAALTARRAPGPVVATRTRAPRSAPS